MWFVFCLLGQEQAGKDSAVSSRSTL